MNAQAQDILKKLRESFERLYKDRLFQLVLFGSHAREDTEPGSDIDLLVVLEGPVDSGEEITRTGAMVTDLCLAYDVVIACVFMDKERFLHRQGPLLRNIRREGITL